MSAKHWLWALGALLLSACSTTSSAPTTERAAGAWSARLSSDGHCLAACPASAPRGDQIIERELYTLANNGRTKFADWVAYVVREDWIGPDRPRNWDEDPDLDPDDTLEEDDYAGAAGPRYQYDMGHQAPLQSFGAADEWATTNYLSNLTPQNLNLNRGRWKMLEIAERDLAERLHRPVYVLTGPLYERTMPALPGADEPHRVPSGYWKVVALGDRRVAGFIFENQAEDATPFCDEQVDASVVTTIRTIERRSGLDLFPGVSLRSLGSLTDELGC